MVTTDIRKQGYPVKFGKTGRYSLRKLLRGVTPKSIKALNNATKFMRRGKPVARELL